MKIAMLFVGRIKSYEECYENFKKNILDPLAGNEIHGFLIHNKSNKIKNIYDFIDKYNIVYFENVLHDLESFKYIEVNKKICGNLNSVNMYYYMYLGNNAIKEYANKHNILYDIIIYLRADQIYNNSLVLPPVILDNTIYVPYGYDYYGLNDQFAFGNVNSMTKYLNLYNYIKIIYDTTHIGFHTETYLLIHMQALNINIVRFDLKYFLNPNRNNEAIL